ncbi:pseudaminic acid cytidylyltransferase [Pleomorphomonas koreensis]|uniref:pseudaminic acid cytidylyltransferase n=1 Tax=Pleomorphomonas koreensis TaxID=257440 RepID=UPI000478AF45|nr:pseudaminic acid cytidylyltransferase [Pleomorphomonas koreensis]
MKLAIIPARGGSKRIPRKNIRPFHGRPIIGWSIEAAKRSGLFDLIVVSTDDEEIAGIALQEGAEVPFMRPADLADDQSSSDAVVAHAIATLRSQGLRFEDVCCIYATAPLLTVEALREGSRLLTMRGHGFVVPVTGFEYPIQRALRRKDDGTLDMFHPEHMNTRSQDLEEAYHDAGQFYWGKADAFLQDLPMFTENSISIRLPRYLVQDIDTPEDWQRAELIFSVLKAGGILP